MRNMFAEALYREATENPDIFIVVADISPVGNMAKFRTEYPERFINVGVAEQSMIGICAGLALKGCQPFAYTIATFSLYRPFEMVRDDLCYQNLPVTVVGMGAGVIYSDHWRHPPHDGGHRDRRRDSEHADRGAMRSSGSRRGNALVRAAEKRAGLSAHWQVRGADPHRRMRNLGCSANCAACGAAPTCASSPMESSARWRAELADRFADDGKSVSLFSCHTLKPLDRRRHRRRASPAQARYRH